MPGPGWGLSRKGTAGTTGGRCEPGTLPSGIPGAADKRDRATGAGHAGAAPGTCGPCGAAAGSTYSGAEGEGTAPRGKHFWETTMSSPLRPVGRKSTRLAQEWTAPAGSARLNPEVRGGTRKCGRRRRRARREM